MRCLMVEPGKKPYEKNIEYKFDILYRELDTDIVEHVFLTPDPVVIVCDENGKLREKEPNRALRDRDGYPYDILVGKFFLFGLEGNKITSLSDEMIRKYSKWMPEVIFKTEKGTVVIPLNEEDSSW